FAVVHKPRRRDPDAVPSAGDVVIDNGWSIFCPDITDKVLYNAARDLEDYFAVSMGVFVGFNLPSAHRIEYLVDPSMDEKSYRLTVTEDKIVLSGPTSFTAARAGYFLEDLLNLAEAPFIKPQDVTRRFLYAPRMIHSGLWLDVFPDTYIRQAAHAGFTSLLVFVHAFDRDRHGYNDFNDLIRRAAEYGLDVYAYSMMLSKAYPEGEEGEKFYDSLYGELFRRCPGLKGVVFVGESVEFPSRDENTSGMLRHDNIGPDGHRIIKKVSPGWWPCWDYYKWVNMVKGIIRREKSDADIVFWSYNWGYVAEDKRIALIDSLPTDISLLVTFEMFEDVERKGVPGRSVDYSIFFEGPGKYFVSEAKAAKRRGIRLYSMTNTAGLCWDVGVIPYMPAPYQWLKRYKEMRKAHDDWGLCGTMDSHHFGWTPSFISDFAKWMFEAPDSDPEKVLRALAARDFSAESADDVLKAYRLFSDAVNQLISTNYDQYGPMRVGAAYPLILNDDFFTFSSPSYAVHGRNVICIPMYMKGSSWGNMADQRIHDTFVGIRNLYSESEKMFDEGAALLEKALETIPERKMEDAKRICNLCRFIAVCIRTAVNVKDWYLKKFAFNAADEDGKKKIAPEMLSIAEKEIENARGAIPMVDFDSRLGFEPSMEYMCDAEHIRAKIAATERVIETELKPYL
ncbi:MAG: hypothetical protein IJV00_02350, partial [Clostridia bacterium]|nr:hypothetical protein [Clostridia bacterium]